MPTLNVGDRVVINWTVAGYSRGPSNPTNEVMGTVTRAGNGAGLVVAVEWDNGSSNSYRLGELTVVKASKKKRISLSRFSPSLVKEAKQLLAESHDPCSNGVAIHVRKGNGLSIQRGPCHGFIRDTGGPSSVAIVTLIVRSSSSLGSSQPDRPIMVAYYDWLFNRSPWADCYKYKSAANAVEEKVCVVRTDVPANLMQGALICTRHTWEYHRNIKLWYELITKHEMNEHEAFIAAFFVSAGDREVMPQGIAHDHVAFSSRNIRADGIHALLTNSPLFKREKFNEGGTYEGVHKAFEGRNGSPVFEEFRRQFNEFGKTSVTKNPFAAAKPKRNDSRSMSIKVYANFAKEFFGKYREVSDE